MSKALKELLSGLEDPRVDRTKKHPLESIIYIVLCGSLAGIGTWSGCEDYAEANIEILSQFIDLPHGVPSHDTIARVISALDVASFEMIFEIYVAKLRKAIKDIISIDGKTIRRSFDTKKGIKARHIVSAWVKATKLVLAQVKVDDKSNEITAIPMLLDMLDLEGQIITIDAMGCQREICQKIKDKEGDYVISLKGNQGTLYEDIKLLFESEEFTPKHTWEEYDKGHGRIEHRKCLVTDDIKWLQEIHNWPGLVSVGVVHSSRDIKDKIREEKRYYISSLPAHAENMARSARDHWDVENGLHWVLDVTFNEDGKDTQ